MPKRTTLADVAARAGLSPTAVSLILNDRPGSRLSADAVTRARAAARELGYRPNQAARTLRMGKTRTVGFISDEVTITRYASAMIRGALDVAEELDHAVLMAEGHSSQAAFSRAFELMNDRQTDALVVASMTARQIPVPETPENLGLVTLNCTTVRPTISVLPAELEAGYAVTRALLDAGHRKIAVIGRSLDETFEPALSVTVPERLRGIKAAFEEASLEPVAVVSYKLWEPSNGYDGTRQALTKSPSLTALLCLNDRLAFGAYQALQEVGRRIPDDISVASFDDEELAAYLRPGLTTARIPYREMGREAMRLSLTNASKPTTHLVPMPLVVRRSIAEA